MLLHFATSLLETVIVDLFTHVTRNVEEVKDMFLIYQTINATDYEFVYDYDSGTTLLMRWSQFGTRFQREGSLFWT